MILKTSDFQNICKTIALAVDNKSTCLELLTDNNVLYMNVTNREYYASVKFSIDSDEQIEAVVDASLFLDLISGISSEYFDLSMHETYLAVKAGKSNYKIALIFENDKLAKLPKIYIDNKTLEMPIKNEVLKSILTANSRELTKLKGIDNSSINELQKLYYVTETGCFTFTTGACLNRFTLEKPVQMLLNDRIVHLFKLFKDDVNFSLGQDPISNDIVQTKVVFETSDVYLAAIISNDEVLLNKIQGPCLATQNFINTKYKVNAVVSANELSSAISRLLLFTKNSADKTNMRTVMTDISITPNEIILTDKNENSESVTICSGSFIEDSYNLSLNIADLKLVLDSCKDEYITMNCGNNQSVVVTHANIFNLIPEGRQK